MDIGLIGLGVMGENLILNLEEKGFSVSVYNRTTIKTDKFIEQNPNKSIKGFSDLKSFVDSLSKPRKIILLVKSGEAVDLMVKAILILLDKNDILIDGGNSFYVDTERRCAEYEVLYLGCGISGGEYGARHGPSMMVGGSYNGWLQIKPIFEKIAAKSDQKPCVAYFGKGGSGHFVKMVHNGIEYCEMQLICEVFTILKLSFTNQQISQIFVEWIKDPKLQSYLLEICIKILERSDNLIDKIVDNASQKGTGMQCIITSMNYSSINTVMSDSVYARMISSEKNERELISKEFKTEKNNVKIEVEEIRKAFLLCKSISYIQGYKLLNKCNQIFNWKINLQTVSEIWKEGCILRGGFLDCMKEISKINLFERSEVFKEIYQKNFASLKYFINICTETETPALCFSSSMNYLNSIKQNKGSGNLIQAMRDFFGSHTLLLEGTNEYVHINW